VGRNRIRILTIFFGICFLPFMEGLSARRFLWQAFLEKQGKGVKGKRDPVFFKIRLAAETPPVCGFRGSLNNP
jgi:hypothetical protein